MKILIVANNGWRDEWEVLTQGIKDFYKPVFDLEFEIVHTDLKPIYNEATGIDGVANKAGTFKMISWDWLRDVVSPYKADIYMFVDSGKQDARFPAGVASGDLIQMFYSNPNLSIYQNGKKVGNSFVNYACHEMAHSIYAKLKVTDRTHEYFYGGNPEKVLVDFKLIPLHKKAILLANELVAKLIERIIKLSTGKK